MGIVIITMPGEAKRAFANALYRKTEGGVSLVIIQRSATDSRAARLKRMSATSVGNLPRELWYGLLLRLSPKLQKTLTYFRGGSLPSSDTEYLPETLVVDSVNTDDVYEKLKTLSPELLVVWGSKVLEHRIIATAKNTINLHLGRGPNYRGTLANQCAVQNDDREHIGATIHRVADHVDAGGIYSVIEPDIKKPPRELFSDLIYRAQLAYLDIAARLYAGEAIPTTPQDETIGKNLLLKDWVPSIRYAVAKKMLIWERASSPRA